MQFHTRRPIIEAVQFDGSAKSIDQIVALARPSDPPAYVMTNEGDGQKLSFGVIPGAPDWIMNMWDWYVVTPEQYSHTSRVMGNNEFRRTYVPTDAELKALEITAAPASQAMTDMQAREVRGTALEAALRISMNTDQASEVVKQAEMFKCYLTGSNPPPPVDAQ